MRPFYGPREVTEVLLVVMMHFQISKRPRLAINIADKPVFLALGKVPFGSSSGALILICIGQQMHGDVKLVKRQTRSNARRLNCQRWKERMMLFGLDTGLVSSTFFGGAEEFQIGRGALVVESQVMNLVSCVFEACSEN